MTLYGASNLEWRRCAFWPEGNDHGGGMADDFWDCGLPGRIYGPVITPGGVREIFDNVPNRERVEGDITDRIYRKVYMINRNIVDYLEPRVWFDEAIIYGTRMSTPSGTDEMSARLGGTVGRIGVSAALSGLATISGNRVHGVNSHYLTETVPGEYIHHDIYDAQSVLSRTKVVQVVSDTELVLDHAYPITGLATIPIGVAPIRFCSFSMPFSYQESTIAPRSMMPGEARAIWAKRIISPGLSQGYPRSICRVRVRCQL